MCVCASHSSVRRAREMLIIFTVEQQKIQFIDTPAARCCACCCTHMRIVKISVYMLTHSHIIQQHVNKRCWGERRRARVNYAARDRISHRR